MGGRAEGWRRWAHARREGTLSLSLLLHLSPPLPSLQIYPGIVEFAKVKIIELSDHLLSTYDREISKYTDAQVRFERERGVEGGGRGRGRGERASTHHHHPHLSSLSLSHENSSNAPASTSS